jgi:hypothetical protein
VAGVETEAPVTPLIPLLLLLLTLLLLVLLVEVEVLLAAVDDVESWET